MSDESSQTLTEGGHEVKAKQWIEILQGFDPEEEIIATIYSRELFGNQNLVALDGSEYDECPKDIWDYVADSYEFRDYVNDGICDDICLSLQEAIDAKGGE